MAIGLIKRTINFFSSFGLACVILLFLLLLTFLGTLEQVDQGLFDVQKKYFESIFLIHEFFGVLPVPLPGVYLLLTLLFINLMTGGLIRIRKGKSTIGIIIIHSGIALLMIGEFVRFQIAQDGQMSLWPEESSNEVESYFEWELAVYGPPENGKQTEYVIPEEHFEDLEGSRTRTFRAEALPFDLTLRNYVRNVDIRPAGLAMSGAVVADGVALHPVPPEKQAEANRPAVVVTTQPKSGGTTRESVLLGLFWMETNPRAVEISGMGLKPYAVEVDDKTWTFDLRKKRWQVPFRIALDRFVWEQFPGTTIPKTYMSDVTKTENGIEQRSKISMNEPLRHRGYTFYQASFGPSNSGPNDPHFSTFAVLKNPTDRFPVYSCFVIAAGMLFHFLQRLLKYLRAESRRAVTT